MTRRKRQLGVTSLFVRRTDHGLYIMVGNTAICSHHAPLHIHAHWNRKHPSHLPKIPVDPRLTYREIVRRIRVLCDSMDREPTLEGLAEALS